MSTKFYNKKARWRKRIKDLDSDTISLVNAAKRGDLRIPILDYKATSSRAVKLGGEGERLIELAISIGASEKSISDIRNLSNHLEQISTRIAELAEQRWGGELKNFPIYRTTMAATADLVKESESIKALDDLLGEGDKK